ncbi:MAG: hypothetical protein D6705_05380 [Deltaproteobacteria bacterium]|nr:MAG: hypothetical protein D6705_05380 [Deltaproteobacteria bacterium]
MAATWWGVLTACRPSNDVAAPRAVETVPAHPEAAGYGVRLARLQVASDGRVLVDLAFDATARAAGLSVARSGVVLYVAGVGYPAVEGPAETFATQRPKVTYGFALPAPPRGALVLALHAVRSPRGALPGTWISMRIAAGDDPEAPE